MKMKVTVQGEAIPVDVDDAMGTATDAQVISFAREKFGELRDVDLQVSRSAEGLSVYPAPQYG